MAKIHCELLNIVELLLSNDDLKHSRHDGRIHVCFDSATVRIAETPDEWLNVVASDTLVIPTTEEAAALRCANDWNASHRWPQAYVGRIDDHYSIIGDCYLPFRAGDLGVLEDILGRLIPASLELMAMARDRLDGGPAGPRVPDPPRGGGPSRRQESDERVAEGVAATGLDTFVAGRAGYL